MPRTEMPNDQGKILEELWRMANELVDNMAELKALYDAHTHNADGAQVGAYYTSTPRTNAAGVTAGTASGTTVGTPAKLSH